MAHIWKPEACTNTKYQLMRLTKTLIIGVLQSALSNLTGWQWHLNWEIRDTSEFHKLTDPYVI